MRVKPRSLGDHESQRALLFCAKTKTKPLVDRTVDISRENANVDHRREHGFCVWMFESGKAKFVESLKEIS